MKKGLPDHGPDAGVGGQCGLQGLRLEPLVQDLHVHWVHDYWASSNLSGKKYNILDGEKTRILFSVTCI